MKRLIFTLLTGFLLFCNTEAQLELDANGNVGIGGTPIASYKLYVEGDVRFDPIDSDAHFLITEEQEEPLLRPTTAGDGYLGTSSYYFYRTYTRYIYRTTEYLLSDKRVKTNIREIESPLTTINKLKGVRFDFTEDAFKNDEPEKRQLLLDKGKGSYGFLAQDVQEVIPQAVDYDSVNDLFYMSNDAIIPLLVEAMKEQQQEILTLKNQIASLVNEVPEIKSILATSAEDLRQNSTINTLFQNSPNPFNEETIIKYFVNDNVGTANIFIYDMSGKQLKNYELHPGGGGEIVIKGGELDSGMYMYTLTADGQVVATKQMILTSN